MIIFIYSKLLALSELWWMLYVKNLSLISNIRSSRIRLWQKHPQRHSLTELLEISQSEVELKKILLENILLHLFGMSNLTVTKLHSCKIIFREGKCNCLSNLLSLNFLSVLLWHIWVFFPCVLVQNLSSQNYRKATSLVSKKLCQMLPCLCYYGLKSSGLWCNYKLCFVSSWCLPHKSRAPQNKILSKCQFNSWQLPSNYFRLALRLNRPFLIRRSHPPFGTDVPCIFSLQALEYSCLVVNLPVNCCCLWYLWMQVCVFVF